MKVHYGQPNSTETTALSSVALARTSRIMVLYSTLYGTFPLSTSSLCIDWLVNICLTGNAISRTGPWTDVHEC